MRERGGLKPALRIGAAWLGAAALAVGLVGLLPRSAAPAAADGPEPEQDLPPARHEGTDVGFRAMLVAGVLMLLTLCGVLGLAAWLYPGAQTDKLLAPAANATFPAPRLQPDVAADMARFRAEQLQQLNGAYWLDRDRRRVHMPIADAMREVAARGIPDWPTAPGWVRR
jgi:hypothetical protein